jgi:hypothetical protein
MTGDEIVNGIGTASILGLLAFLGICSWRIHGDTRKAQHELNAESLTLGEHALRSRSFPRNPSGSLTIQCSWEDLEDGLIKAYTSGWGWRVGGAFTGVALFVTFLLIGFVLHRNLGVVLSNPAPGAADLDSNKALLGSAVEQMGSKFWVSACGVACT